METIKRLLAFVPELWHTMWLWIGRAFISKQKQRRREDWRERWRERRQGRKK